MIKNQSGDESCSDIDPKKNGLHYYSYIDTTPTDEDFRRVVNEYMGWKAGEMLRTLDPSLTDKDIGGNLANLSLLMTRHPTDFKKLMFEPDGFDYAR